MKAVGENKKCSKCGEWKHVSDFSRCKSLPDGLNCSCKACDLARRKAYYDANAEKIREKRRAGYYENREAAIAATKRWAEKNKDHLTAYRAANRDRRREYEHAYRAAHREVDAERKARARAKANWAIEKLRELGVEI